MWGLMERQIHDAITKYLAEHPESRRDAAAHLVAKALSQDAHVIAR